MHKEIGVSALLPIKNGEKWIDGAITGMLANLSADDEALVINNGSTDKTFEKISYWAEMDNRVRVINLNTGGLVEALNLGLKESKFTWIARFDVDDTYSSDRLLFQRKLISDSVCAIFSDYEFIGGDNFNLGAIPTAIYPDPVTLSLISSQRTPHPSVLLDKNIAKSVGGFRSFDYPVEDLSLWLRMAKVSNLISCPKLLLSYNLHQSSISAKNKILMNEKRNLLIREIGIDLKVARSVLDNFENYIKKYENDMLSAERSILLLRDLYIYNNFFSEKLYSKGNFFNLLFGLMKHKKYYNAVYRLNLETLQRRRYRNFAMN
jgi:glycosyltransferase involved in cell wall biosynthesis